MSYLPDELYATVERTMPIACVDFVVTRPVGDGVEYGLILRDSPFGRVWCHLGGRIRRDETIAEALRRHASETLGVGLDIDDDPQPDWVYQWFPDRHPDGLVHGTDPQKHAIGLSFVVPAVGMPTPSGEALDFGYFGADELPEPLWPGCVELFARLGLAG